MMLNRKLLSLARPVRKWLFLTVLSKLVAVLLNIVIIINMATLIEKLQSGRWEHAMLLVPAIVIGASLIVRFLATFWESRFSFLCSAEIKLDLREALYRKLLEIEMQYTKKQGTAAIVAMAVDGVEALDLYYGRYLPQLFYSLLAPLILFGVVFRFYPFSAVVLLGCVPLIPLSIVAVVRLAKKLTGRFWDSYANLGAYFLDSLQGLLTLKIFNGDAERAQKLNANAGSFRKITMKVLGMQLNSITMMDLIAFGGAAAGLLTAVAAMKTGQIGVKAAVVILLLAPEFFIPFRVLGSYFHTAMNGVAASEKLFALLELEPDILGPLGDAPPVLTGIEFQNVSFSYGPGRPVLDNVSFRIPPGSIYALVGESGCGKSTIASLIMGFHTPEKGAITINGMALKSIPRSMLRRLVTVVTHDAYIFAGTVADNLKFAKTDVTEAEMMAACKMAGLGEFVAALPEGLNTDVGEMGSRLSGGERQRLGLARAILYDAEFYIFDEATSNVDVESENAIWKSIYKLAERKTVLVISHRLATVRGADQIMVLQNKTIGEQGTDEELLRRNGLYSKLVGEQKEYERFEKGGTDFAADTGL
jgi:ATP-binding cassette subfamily C protein